MPTEEAQRTLDVRLGTRGGVGIDVGLVDDDQVGQLHHALLDRLQVVTGIGQLQQHEHVGHAGDRRFALTDTHCFDDHHVVAGGLAHQHRLARFFGHAAERARGRAGADIGCLVDRQHLHARLVAEDRSARQARRRVDGEHRHAVAGFDQRQAEHFDEGRLADTGNARNAQAHRFAGLGQERVEQGIGTQPVIGTGRLQQRDRLS